MPVVAPKYPLVRTAASPTSTAASTHARSSTESSARLRRVGSLSSGSRNLISDPPRFLNLGPEPRHPAAVGLRLIYEFHFFLRRHPRSRRSGELVARDQDDRMGLGGEELRFSGGGVLSGGRSYLHAGAHRVGWPGSP